MDSRFAIDVGHLFLHLSTYLLPSCPNCVCACPESAITQVVPPSLDQALKFCHSIADGCTKQPEPQQSWSLSVLFWIGFMCGIGFCVLCAFLYQFVKRVLISNSSTSTNASPASSPARLAVESSSVIEPANPRVLQELGLLKN